MRDPGTIGSMHDLRAEIDLLDAALVDLLAERARFIDRAIELKPAEGFPARIGSRVDEVLARVRDRAAAKDLDPDLAEQLWRIVIEWSIAREEAVLGKGGAE